MPTGGALVLAAWPFALRSSPLLRGCPWGG